MTKKDSDLTAFNELIERAQQAIAEASPKKKMTPEEKKDMMKNMKKNMKKKGTPMDDEEDMKDETDPKDEKDGKFVPPWLNKKDTKKKPAPKAKK